MMGAAADERRRRRSTPTAGPERRPAGVIDERAAPDDRHPDARHRRPAAPAGPQPERPAAPSPRRAGVRGRARLVIAVAVGVGLSAGTAAAHHRRPRRDDLPARARPLPHRQVGGHEGHRVLHRLRPPALVVPAGRDRVRPQGHPRRGLREDHRDEQPRRGRPRRRAPHLPPASPYPAAHVRRRRRLDHALPHGLRAVLRGASPSSASPPQQPGPGAGRHLRRARLGRSGASRPTPAPTTPASSPATASSSIDGQPTESFDDVGARSSSSGAGRDASPSSSSATASPSRSRRRSAQRPGRPASASASSASAPDPDRPDVTGGVLESSGWRWRRSGATMKDTVVSLGQLLSPEGSASSPPRSSRAVGEAEPAAGPATGTGGGRTVDEGDANRLVSIFGVARLGADMSERRHRRLPAAAGHRQHLLGIFNLVPLLPLDGGHVAIATYERIRSIGGRRYHADVAKLLPLTYAVVHVPGADRHLVDLPRHRRPPRPRVS